MGEDQVYEEVQIDCLSQTVIFFAGKSDSRQQLDRAY